MRLAVYPDDDLLVKKLIDTDPVFCALPRYRKWVKKFNRELKDFKGKPSKKKKIPESEWNALKEKYYYTCAGCGKREPDEILLTQDHIIPKSWRGSYPIIYLHSVKNIQPLCLECNRCKADGYIRYPLPLGPGLIARR